MKPLQVFIGYDPNEPIAYHILAHSIMRRASRPVSVTPLYRPQLTEMGVYTRMRTPTESTEFSLTRFLVPWLTNFDGVSIFMDCDMLCLTDICELQDIALSDPYKDIFCVQHEYVPRPGKKFLGQYQATYPRKNWSSLMVFNGHRMGVRQLTPQYVNAAPPSELHQMLWARDIGALGAEWNHLVGEYLPRDDAKIVHYTLGGPYFPDYFGCEYTEHWFAEAANALRATGGKHLLQELQNHAMMSGNISGGKHGQKSPEATANAETGPHAA